MRIHPGRDQEPIRCDLVPARLPTATTSFEAISYSWASALPGDRIDEGALCGFRVTRTVKQLLRWLRRPDRERLVWIDSICIDQNNSVERGQQVAIMKQIYSSASQVIVWLGEWADARSRIDDMSQSDLWQPFSRPNTEDEYYKLLMAALDGPEAWWRRVWVYQECAVAQSINVMFGRSVVPWELFWVYMGGDQFPDIIGGSENTGPIYDIRGSDRFESGFEAISKIDSLRKAMQVWKSRGLPFTNLLDITSSSFSSDSLDKVYALLGLASPDVVADFEVDYSLSSESVFLQAKCAIIRTEHYLNVLVGGWPVLPSLGLSWLPDFSAIVQNKRSLMGAGHCNAYCDESRFSVSLKGGENADVLLHIYTSRTTMRPDHGSADAPSLY